MFSQFVGEAFAANIRNIAFAIFVPLYFLAVGLKVNIDFVIAHIDVLVALIVVASVFKLASIYVTSAGSWGRSGRGRLRC